MVTPFANAVARAEGSPNAIHDTSITDGFKQQAAVKTQLLKDYPGDEDQAAIQDGFTHLETAKGLVKDLRAQAQAQPKAETEAEQGKKAVKFPPKPTPPGTPDR